VGELNCGSIAQINTSNSIQFGRNLNIPLIETSFNNSNDRYGYTLVNGGFTYFYSSQKFLSSAVALGFATNSNAYDNRLTIENSTSNILFHPDNSNFSLLIGVSNAAVSDGACAFQVGANRPNITGCTACFNTFGTSNYLDTPGVVFKSAGAHAVIHGNRVVMRGGTSSLYRMVLDTLGNDQGNIEAMNNASNAIALNLNKRNGGLVFVGSNLSVGSNLIVSGKVGVGNANPAFQLQLSTDSAAKASTTTWTVASDERVKENVQVADYGLCYSNVQALDLKRYTYSATFQEQTRVEDKSKLGWIAQDVRPIFPKAVHEADAPEYGLSNMLNVDFDQVYAMMYGALRHTMSNIDGLESVVGALEIQGAAGAAV
jgi:hypothetical protein